MSELSLPRYDRPQRGVLRAALFLLAACVVAAARTPSTSTAKVFPMEVELLSPFNSAKLQVGDTVLTKLTKEWSEGPCRLPRGSAVSGRITAVSSQSSGSRQTSVSVLFDWPCPEQPVRALTWIALLAPDDSGLAGLDHGNPVAVQAFRSATFGESGGLGQSGVENHVDMSGHQNPNLPVFIDPAPDRKQPRPQAVSSGEVWHLQNLKLDPGSGPLGSSTLSSKAKSLKVPSGAVLVLSPESEAVTVTVTVPQPHIAGPPPPPRPVPIHDDPATCAAPACTVVSSAAWPAVSSPSQTLPLKDLGYSRLRSAEILDFEYGAALAYLGPDQLLFTFNPHMLVSRTAQDDPVSHPHMVRAVLVDLNHSTAQHLAIERVIDWRVGDARQYLWPLPGNRVLVHAGQDLILFGPGLQEIQRVPLAGPLAFLRHSPDGTHFAVGVIRELHTSKVHQELLEISEGGPEEETSVLSLDGELRPVGSDRQSSRAMPPVLINQGVLTLVHSGGEHWRYQLHRWTGESQTVIRLGSACIPTMSSLAADTLFVQGCRHNSVERWYRVLRLDGTSVLQGDLLSQDVDPLALADGSGDAISLTLPKARAGFISGLPYHAADLTMASTRVYHAGGGSNPFLAVTRSPAPTRQPAAFAPGGSGIALLDGDQIAVYDFNTGQPGKLQVGMDRGNDAARPVANTPSTRVPER